MEKDPAALRFLTERYRLLLGAVLLLALLIRVGAYCNASAVDPTFQFVTAADSVAYLDWAERISGGDVLGDRVFFLGPLYPYFLGGVTALAGDEVLLWTRLFQALLGLLTVLLIASTTKRLFGPRTAILAALIAVLYPYLLSLEQKVLIATLAVFLNALTLWLLVRFKARPTRPAIFLAGLSIGISVLARPNVLLFALLLPAWFLVQSPSRRLRFAASRTALLFAGLAVVVLPVTWRNWAVGGDLVPVSSSLGVNLWQSNNPLAWESGSMISRELQPHPGLMETDAARIAEEAEGRTLKPSEVSRYWQNRTLSLAKEEPGRTLGFLGRKLSFFLLGVEQPSNYCFALERRQVILYRLLPITFAAVSPFMLLGGFLVLRTRRDALPLVLLVIAYVVGLVVFFPQGRYRAPFLPAAIPLAALAIAWCADLVRRRSWRSCSAAAVALLILTAATQYRVLATTLGQADADLANHYGLVIHCNNGFFLLERGAFAEAEECYRTAASEHPESTLPWLGLADLGVRRNDPAAEAAALAEVLKREPDHIPALLNLGSYLYRSGEWERGRSLIRRAAELAPRDLAVQEALKRME